MARPTTQRHTQGNTFPENKKDCTNVGLMLGQRRRRWTNINQALVQCLVFVGQGVSQPASLTQHGD